MAWQLNPTQGAPTRPDPSPPGGGREERLPHGRLINTVCRNSHHHSAGLAPATAEHDTHRHRHPDSRRRRHPLSVCPSVCLSV